MPARKKKEEGQPTRAAFYIRWSSHNQDAENTMEGQLSALQAHADANGQIHVATYVDEAISGRRDDRADMNRLMRDAHQRERPFDEVSFGKSTGSAAGPAPSTGAPQSWKAWASPSPRSGSPSKENHPW